MTKKIQKYQILIQNPVNIYDGVSLEKKILVFGEKALPQILDWVLNTPQNILNTQESGAFYLLQYIKLYSYVIKCSPFYQKQIAKRHIYAYLIVGEAQEFKKR